MCSTLCCWWTTFQSIYVYWGNYLWLFSSKWCFAFKKERNNIALLVCAVTYSRIVSKCKWFSSFLLCSPKEMSCRSPQSARSRLTTVCSVYQPESDQSCSWCVLRYGGRNAQSIWLTHSFHSWPVFIFSKSASVEECLALFLNPVLTMSNCFFFFFTLHTNTCSHEASDKNLWVFFLFFLLLFASMQYQNSKAHLNGTPTIVCMCSDKLGVSFSSCNSNVVRMNNFAVAHFSISSELCMWLFLLILLISTLPGIVLGSAWLEALSAAVRRPPTRGHHCRRCSNVHQAHQKDEEVSELRRSTHHLPACGMFAGQLQSTMSLSCLADWSGRFCGLFSHQAEPFLCHILSIKHRDVCVEKYVLI